jgi:hypothetical protein
MLSALPVLVGVQLLLAFIGYDIASVPRRAIHPALAGREQTSAAGRPSSSGSEP